MAQVFLQYSAVSAGLPKNQELQSAGPVFYQTDDKK